MLCYYYNLSGSTNYNYSCLAITIGRIKATAGLKCY